MIAVANFIGLPLLFLSTTMIARAQMPDWMQTRPRASTRSTGASSAARERSCCRAPTGARSASHLGYLLALTAVTARARPGRSALPALALSRRPSDADRPGTQIAWPVVTAAPLRRRARRRRPRGARRPRSPSSSPRRRRSPARPRPRRPSATRTSSTVPCIGLTTTSPPPAPRGSRAALAPPARELAVAAARAAAPSPRRGDRPPRPLSLACRLVTTLRPALRLPSLPDERTARRLLRQLLATRRAPWHVSPATKHGCASSARWKPSSDSTPPISNSASARSIRRRACSRSASCTISFAIIGS